MKLKNVLIVVSDIERSIRFYRDIFGLQVLLDQDGLARSISSVAEDRLKYWI